MKRILGWGLLLFALFSLAYAGWLTFGSRKTSRESDQSSNGDVVLVYFIHGRAKCPTCDLILAHTRASLDTSFAEEMKNGRLKLVKVDVEKPGNEHFMKDFNLFTTSVVLYHRAADGKATWKNLDKAWELAEDGTAFTEYFRISLERFLEEARP